MKLFKNILKQRDNMTQKDDFNSSISAMITIFSGMNSKGTRRFNNQSERAFNNFVVVFIQILLTSAIFHSNQTEEG